MKEISRFVNEYWIVILGTLLIPIILGQVLRVPLGYLTIGEEGDWVSFFGNYSGGIIGGIVAFLVARNQIEKQNNKEAIRNLSKELPILMGIELECKKILCQLININEFIEEIEDKNSYKSLFDGLIWSRWSDINIINDPVLQEELIKHFEALKRNIEIFEIDVNVLESKLEGKKALLRKMYPLDKGYTELLNEVSEESVYLDMVKHDKIHYLIELSICIAKTEKIDKGVNKRRLKIHDILKKSTYYNNELLTSPADYRVKSR